MRPRQTQRPMDKMRLALDLFEAGIAVERQNLRRRFPEATEGEIEEKFLRWLFERPGAEDGDGVGIPRPPRQTST